MKEKFHAQCFTIYVQQSSNFYYIHGYAYQLSADWKKFSVGASGEEIF